MFEPKITLQSRLCFILGVNSLVARRIIEHQASTRDLLTAHQNSHLALEDLLRLFLQPETAIQLRSNPNTVADTQLKELPGLNHQLIPIIRQSRPFFSIQELQQVTQLPEIKLQELFELPSYHWHDKPQRQISTVTPVTGIYTAIASAPDFESVSVAEQPGYTARKIAGGNKQIVVLQADDFESGKAHAPSLKKSFTGRICPAVRDAEGFVKYLVPLAIDLWLQSDVDRNRLNLILTELQLKLANDHPESLIDTGFVRAVIPGCPIDTDPLRAVLDVVQQAEAYPEIRFAEPEQIGIDDFGLDTTNLADSQTDFEASGGNWNLEAINLAAAHQITQGSTKVTIFVIDGGIETTHPDVAPALRQDWQNLDLNFTTSDPESAKSPEELDLAHGTQVTSVAVAQGKNEFDVAQGIAPQCKVLPIKISGSMGYGSRAAAIRQAIAMLGLNERGIINLSWRINGEHLGIREALIEAERKGLAIVTSAGNYRQGEPQISNQLHYPSAYRYRYPQLKSLCSVAAVNVAGEKANYSYFGDRSITVAAPGGESGTAGTAIYVASPINQYAYVYGTSFAAPHVAGLLGLMFAVNPQLSAQEAIAIIEQTAQSNFNTESEQLGKGIIDAHAALLAVSNSDDAAFSPPSSEENNKPAEGKINLNTASFEELAALPLMNTWRIQHLIDYREKNQPLQSIWDLLNIDAFDLWVIYQLKDLVLI